MFFLAWNIEIFYSKGEYVILFFWKYVIKNSDGVIPSEDWTLFDKKGLIAFRDIRSIYLV